MEETRDGTMDGGDGDIVGWTDVELILVLDEYIDRQVRVVEKCNCHRSEQHTEHKSFTTY